MKLKYGTMIQYSIQSEINKLGINVRCKLLISNRKNLVLKDGLKFSISQFFLITNGSLSHNADDTHMTFRAPNVDTTLLTESKHRK